MIPTSQLIRIWSLTNVLLDGSIGQSKLSVSNHKHKFYNYVELCENSIAFGYVAVKQQHSTMLF
jgi:hypothetical protein